MKKLFNLGFYILLIVTTKTAFAQDEKPHLGVSNVFKLNFFLPGVSYEQKIGTYQTLNFGVYMDGIIADKFESVNRQSRLLLTPTFNLEFRNYYNINRRAAGNKNTALNSANYIAALYLGRYSHTSYLIDPFLVQQGGVVWGMQRNSPKGFSLDLNGGVAYTFNANNYYYFDHLELIVQAKIGFWLGRRTR